MTAVSLTIVAVADWLRALVTQAVSLVTPMWLPAPVPVPVPARRVVGRSR